MLARHTPYKKVERKAKPQETQSDNIKTTSSKPRPQIPPNGPGSGPMGQTVGPKRGLSAPVPSYKKISRQDKKTNKLYSLMFITQTQPSAMVWGKSWKYSNALPILEKDMVTSSFWGHSWMFATQQPYTEAGQPWPNGPNKLNPPSLRLWKKPAYKVVDLEHLDLTHPTEDWESSWRQSDNDNKKEMSSLNGENVDTFGKFSWLVRTQCHNESLCTSEWSGSWKSTKPSSQQAPYPPTTDGLNKEAFRNKQDNEDKFKYEWEECWKYVNHQLCDKSKSPSHWKSQSPGWVDSWKLAMLVSNIYKKSQSSVQHGENNIHDYPSQQKESHLHKVIMFVSHEQQSRNLSLQLFNEFKDLSEWSKSWQVTKNNSKPSEEIENILKVSSPNLEEYLAQRLEKKSNEDCLTFKTADMQYEHLKHKVISQPKIAFTQNKMLCLNHLQNVLSGTEWKDSWRTLKHFIRMGRRRTRPHPSRSFRESEMEGERMPNTSEWENSWKFTNQPLQQESALWQQGWTTTPQIRVVRAMDHNHFRQVEPPRNGPGVAQPWVESWSFSRCQHISEHRSGSAQTNTGRPSVASHHPENSQREVRRNARSVSDWQVAWMVSETQFRHDRPSLMQWMEAWRWSAFQTERWHEQIPRQNWMDKSMEIEPQREISLQRAKTNRSQSFDYQVFRQRYPENLWSASWKAWPLLNNQQRHQGSSSQQQQTIATEEGSAKWGKSFRIANPMPHTEQPWVQSSPNLCYYTVMWSADKSRRNHQYANFNKDLTGFKYWGNSHRLLQEGRKKIKDKGKTNECTDPWLIIGEKVKTGNHLNNNIERVVAGDRKWTGCHLLAKTQPRLRKSSSSEKNVKVEEETKDKFFDKWAESWRFSAQPRGLKNRMPVRSLSDWGESWKFLIPL